MLNQKKPKLTYNGKVKPTIVNNLNKQKNILRQITDIQVQAERLIKNKSDITQVEQFAAYSNEIKTFLLNNISDEFILNQIKEIPDLDLEQTESNSRFINLFLNVLGGSIGIYSSERRKADEALDKIRDIRGKYASTEFMLKNYFE